MKYKIQFDFGLTKPCCPVLETDLASFHNSGSFQGHNSLILTTHLDRLDGKNVAVKSNLSFVIKLTGQADFLGTTTPL